MTHKLLEIKDVEKPFVDYVTEQGYFALKLNIIGRRGLPDRMVLGPNKFIAFFELKRPGKKAEPLQAWWHDFLSNLGFDVICADTKEKAIVAFEKLKGEHRGR